MNKAATAQLDDRQFERALSIVERERPTPLQARRFQLLQLVVWGAFLFTAAWLYLVFGFSASTAYPALMLALACYLAVIPLFLLNLVMIRQLWRAAVLRRTLRLTELLRPHFRKRRLRHRVYNRVTFAMSLFGYIVCLLGLMLLAAPDAAGLLTATIVFFWGLSCIAIHFMARGAERFRVISDLRAALLKGKASSPAGTSEPVVVAAEHYDAISRLERAQIRHDRQRSIASGMHMKSQGYVMRVSRSVRETEQTLEPTELVSLHATLYRLSRDPAAVSGVTDPETGQVFTPIPGTPFEIGFSVDETHREVRVYSLRRVDAATPRAAAAQDGTR